MIRPQIIPYSEEYADQLERLLKVANWPHEFKRVKTDFMYLALHDGMVVGFAAGYHDGGAWGSVDWVLVSPEIKFMGVGYFLFKYSIEALRKMGATHIQGYTRKPDVAEYMERLGFMETDLYKVYEKTYDPPEDSSTHS